MGKIPSRIDLRNVCKFELESLHSSFNHGHFFSCVNASFLCFCSGLLRENPPPFRTNRFPQGESGLDVYNRATSFIATMFRDFANENIARDDLNVIIVTHGLTLRLVSDFSYMVHCYEMQLRFNRCNVVRSIQSIASIEIVNAQPFLFPFRYFNPEFRIDLLTSPSFRFRFRFRFRLTLALAISSCAAGDAMVPVLDC